MCTLMLLLLSHYTNIYFFFYFYCGVIPESIRHSSRVLTAAVPVYYALVMQNLVGKMFTCLATGSHCKVWKLKHCLVTAVASHWTDKRISRRDRHSFLYARHVPRKELPYNTVSSCKHNAIPIFEQEFKKKKRSISGYFFFPCRFFFFYFYFLFTFSFHQKAAFLKVACCSLYFAAGWFYGSFIVSGVLRRSRKEGKLFTGLSNLITDRHWGTDIKIMLCTEGC